VLYSASRYSLRRADMAELADATDFDPRKCAKRSALSETAGAERLKFGEPSRVVPVVIPSQARGLDALGRCRD